MGGHLSRDFVNAVLGARHVRHASRCSRSLHVEGHLFGNNVPLSLSVARALVGKHPDATRVRLYSPHAGSRAVGVLYGGCVWRGRELRGLSEESWRVGYCLRGEDKNHSCQWENSLLAPFYCPTAVVISEGQTHDLHVSHTGVWFHCFTTAVV